MYSLSCIVLFSLSYLVLSPLDTTASLLRTFGPELQLTKVQVAQRDLDEISTTKCIKTCTKEGTSLLIKVYRPTTTTRRFGICENNIDTCVSDLDPKKISTDCIPTSKAPCRTRPTQREGKECDWTDSRLHKLLVINFVNPARLRGVLENRSRGR